MSYTYNTSTDRGLVRLYIRDTTHAEPPIQGKDYVFTDAEIDAFLDQNSSDVWAAAADACRTLAADEILGALRLKLNGFEIDREKVPNYWLKLAEGYDKKAKDGAVVEYVDSFDHKVSAFGEDETEYIGDIV